MKIYLAADHRGFELKEKIKKALKKSGVSFEDLGNKIFDPNDDYPDFAIKVAKRVAQNKKNKGILICGSGAGVCIAANKVKGARAAQSFTPKHAKHLRTNDNINILCLDADWLKINTAKNIAKTFLETEFSNLARHKRRIQKIKKIEQRWHKKV